MIPKCEVIMYGMMYLLPKRGNLPTDRPRAIDRRLNRNMTPHRNRGSAVSTRLHRRTFTHTSTIPSPPLPSTLTALTNQLLYAEGRATSVASGTKRAPAPEKIPTQQDTGAPVHIKKKKKRYYFCSGCKRSRIRFSPYPVLH